MRRLCLSIITTCVSSFFSCSVFFRDLSAPPTLCFFFFKGTGPPRDLPSFPPRRSSDLLFEAPLPQLAIGQLLRRELQEIHDAVVHVARLLREGAARQHGDPRPVEVGTTAVGRGVAP